MDDKFQLSSSGETLRRSPYFRIAALTGAIVLVLIFAAIFWSQKGSRNGNHTEGSGANFGTAEQAYAGELQIENLDLSRAENFLHQEVTSLSAEVVNSGNRSLTVIELKLEFFDDLRQVVLRERRTVVSPPASPLAPKERRSFEISFEHLPTSWNMQMPTVQIAGLQFSSR